MKNFSIIIGVVLVVLLGSTSCKNMKNNTESDNVAVEQPIGPQFNADSAYFFCAQQCEFGPRIMNSDAHDKCEQWIADKFRQYGCQVKLQKADVTGYDGTVLHATNIMASFRPEATTRILICAHWDSRPWADNDPDEKNHRTPVMAANDGASGVAVMIELARLLCENQSADNDTTQIETESAKAEEVAGLLPLNKNIGIDFVCFDAEDWGTPQWAEETTGDTWALGAQYFATHLPDGYEARYGILLDMVGGEGAQFYKEYMSNQYAPAIVDKVWAAAQAAGYGNFFPNSMGAGVTDDHIPLNQKARIPTIDIISYYPDCQQSSFGPTWHTISDTMDHIDKRTLKAVGQTLIQVLYTEE